MPTREAADRKVAARNALREKMQRQIRLAESVERRGADAERARATREKKLAELDAKITEADRAVLVAIAALREVSASDEEAAELADVDVTVVRTARKDIPVAEARAAADWNSMSRRKREARRRAEKSTSTQTPDGTKDSPDGESKPQAAD